MKIGKIRLSFSFIILLCVLYYLDTTNLLILLIISAAVHEAGHYAAIKLCGGSMGTLNLSVAGAVMVIQDGKSMSYGKELICAAAGPLASLMLGLISALLAGRWGNDKLYVFSGISMVFGVINLLPVYPLDGGRMIYILLKWKAGLETADAAGFLIGLIATTGLGIFGMYSIHLGYYGYTLVLAAVWLFFITLKQNRLSSGSIRYRIAQVNDRPLGVDHES